MNISTLAGSAYQNTIDSVSEQTSGLSSIPTSGNTKKSKSDMLEISDNAYNMQSKSANAVVKSGNEYLSATRGSGNTIVIHLTDSAMVSRTVQIGYITINGIKIELSDGVKTALLETDAVAQADRENAFWMNVTWHNMQVAKQQSDTYQEAAQNEAKAFKTASRIASGGCIYKKILHCFSGFPLL